MTVGIRKAALPLDFIIIGAGILHLFLLRFFKSILSMAMQESVVWQPLTRSHGVGIVCEFMRRWTVYHK